MSSAEFEPMIPAFERPQSFALGYGYIGARTDTTLQSGQTPDNEVEIKKTLQFTSAATLKPIRLECYLPRLSGVSVWPLT